MNSTSSFRRAVLMVFFIITATTVCFGQSYWKRDFGPGFIFRIHTHTEGIFELFGQSGTDVFMMIVSSDGDTVSTNTYGEPNSIYSSILETPDCFLICAGQRENKGRLMKITTGGDTAWTRTFDESDSYFSTTTFTTSDYNFLFAGGTEGKAWLVKIQSDGTVIWSKTYGKSPSSFTSIYETEDGDFLLSGSTENRASVMKITRDGDTLWTKVYADTTSGFQSILYTEDDHFLLPGFCKGNAWLVKITPDGDTVWTKTYGNGYSYLNSVLAAPDSNFIVAGQQSDQMTTRPLVMKIRPDGDTVWTKTYMDNAHTITFVACEDDNFLLSGITTQGPSQYCWLMSIIDNKYAYKNQPFTFTIPSANSTPSDHVYTPVKAPSGMTLDTDGTISWNPETDSVYIQQVEYARENGAGQKDTLRFAIFVNSQSAASKKPVGRNDLTMKDFDIRAVPSTSTIKFILPSGCSSVRIYTITGKLLVRLLPTKSVNGTYAVLGDMRGGCTIPNGKYFARVFDGKNSRVKPFLFVR